VRGIGPDAIPGYLGSLTPVVLVHDTVVTNHGFAGGAATAFGSVLQAGTAVLVDATGLPVVRCACGNPLTAPPRFDLSAADVQGTRWDGYDPAGTLTVVPGSAVAQFVVVDVATGQDLTVTAGPVAAPPTSAPPSTTPTPSVAATTDQCILELDWPEASLGWIESPEGNLTCKEMIDQWRRYEQWPGERGGSQQWVTFDDGWTCTTTLASETTSAVGHCGQSDDRRFAVHKGLPDEATATTASPSPAATSPSSTLSGSVEADLLITPSGNIECARKDGEFACTIKEINGDLGDERCPGERGFIVRLDATGSPDGSDCRGDFFTGITWPAPTGYGTTATLGDVTCTVEETGVTCTNGDGHGFALARAGYGPF
jgi:hypothetical protein